MGSDFLKSLKNFIIGTKESQNKQPISQMPIQKPVIADAVIHFTGNKSIEDLSVGIFPIINLQERPSRNEYISVKDKYVNEVFEACRDYYEFVCDIQAIKNRDDIKKAIERMIREFIAIVWDLPASDNHHHPEPWGLLVHSLETACREAQLGANLVLYDQARGTADSENTKKMLPFNILGGFIVGLLHDAGKIFDVNISYNDPQTNMSLVYNAIRGSLLDFYLTYSNMEYRRVRWIRGRGGLHKRRSAYLFMTIIPRTVMDVIPKEIFLNIWDSLVSYEALDSDKMSVASNIDNTNKLAVIQKTLGEGIKTQRIELNIPGKSTAYKIDKNYYVVVFPVFFKMLAGMCSTDEKTLVSLLHEAGLIVRSASNEVFKKDILLHLSPGKKDPTPFNLTFVRAEFFDKPLMKVLGLDLVGQEPDVSRIKIDVSEKENIKEFFAGNEPAMQHDAFFDPKTAPTATTSGKGRPTPQMPSKNRSAPNVQETIGMPSIKTDKKTDKVKENDIKETSVEEQKDLVEMLKSQLSSKNNKKEPDKESTIVTKDETIKKGHSKEKADKDTKNIKETNNNDSDIKKNNKDKNNEKENRKDHTIEKEDNVIEISDDDFLDNPTQEIEIKEESKNEQNILPLEELSDFDKDVRDRFLDFILDIGNKKYTLQKKGNGNMGFLLMNGETCFFFPRALEAIHGQPDMEDSERKKLNNQILYSLNRQGFLIPNGEHMGFIKQKVMYLIQDDIGSPKMFKQEANFFKISTHILEELVPEFAEYIEHIKALNKILED